MRALTTTIVIAVGMSFAGPVFAQSATACRPQAIPTLGGTDVHADDINERGWVVGRSSLPNDAVEHAFLWQRGRVVDLGSLAEGANSAATAINDRGTIVGYGALGAGGDPVPIVWTADGPQQLSFSGAMAVAVDVNNRGQIIGNQDFSECLLWEDANSEPIVLGSLGGTFCLASAINDFGLVVGTATTGSGDTRAFVWRDGRMREAESFVDEPGDYSFSELLDVDARGLAVGRLQTGGLVTRPFIWTPRGGGRVLEVTDTVAAAVNSRGTIVLAQHFEEATLLLADARGRVQTVGTLGGGVSYDDLAVNDRAQIAWTALAGEPLHYSAYVCSLR